MRQILLGLSGGVDSAVAASILMNEGYNVTGCFLLLTEDSSPDSPEAISAKQTADILGIELITADYRKRFKEYVSDYFVSEYLSGKTPNPCIRCNPTVKIHSLIETAENCGIEKIATGHYALTEHSEKHAQTVLKASPSKKDQSYFLSRLSPSQIEKVVFPLGKFSSKEEVRLYAQNLCLPNAKKADSQEICFIPDNNYQNYICTQSDFISVPGVFLDNDNTPIGTHTGIINYTVGQRKGLGAFGEPRYVKSINAKDNTITLCKKDERFAASLDATDISWAISRPMQGELSCKVKIRSTAPAAPGTVHFRDDGFSVSFLSPVLAPTPGQTAAIYDDDNIIIASGIIV